MGYVYVCNTSSDYVTKVSVEDMVEICKIRLGVNSFDKVGPCGICLYKDKVLVANCFSNNLSILNKEKEIDTQYIGAHCNDVCVHQNKAYISCADSNCIVVYNLDSRQITHQIPCQDQPHSICVDFKRNKFLVANMQGDSVTVMDIEEFNNIKHVKVGSYPTKAMYSLDGEYIFVCESNVGSFQRGSLNIISAQSLKTLYKIQVGFAPMDIDCDNECCYISNFGEGTISVINIEKHREEKKINVGGMPKSIKKAGEFLLVGDYYNNLLIKINIANESKKAIRIGKDPNSMALY